MRKRILKILGYTIGSIVILVLGLWLYLWVVATVTPPIPADTSYLSWTREQLGSNRFTIKNNWLRKSESGLYEMYVEGNPFERGVAIGKLTKELANYQEEAFVNQL